MLKLLMFYYMDFNQVDGSVGIRLAHAPSLFTDCLLITWLYYADTSIRGNLDASHIYYIILIIEKGLN